MMQAQLQTDAQLEEELRMYRETVREFIKRDVLPHHEEWEKEGIVSREVWEKAGENGLLCMDVPEEYGGLGVDDYRFLAILAHEMAYFNTNGPGFIIQNELVVPYLMAFGTEEQKQKYLPKMATGELVTALAMTEPNAGSDLQGVQTTAIRNGDYYVVNGQKTFISNGIMADMVITAVKTDPEQGARGMSLLCIERGMEGFERGRNLDKIGMKAQDTAELYFKDVKVPVENLLGEEGKGFFYLMHNLPQERLSIAISALGQAEAGPRYDGRILQRANRIWPADRQIPKFSFRFGRDQNRSNHWPYLCRQLHRQVNP